MSARKPPPDCLLARAAEVRAEGGNWTAAAERVGRSARTVRRWPLAYPDRWREAMRAATRQAVDDAAAESVFVLRQIARGDDAKLRVQAAKSLIYQRIELTRMELQAAAQLPPPPPSDAQLIAEFVRGHTREQLIQLGANLLNARVPECLALQPADADGGA